MPFKNGAKLASADGKDNGGSHGLAEPAYCHKDVKPCNKLYIH